MDQRDFRIRCDFAFPPEEEGVARGLIQHLLNQISKAVRINPGQPNEERGYVSLERCGPRINQACEVIENHDVE